MGIKAEILNGWPWNLPKSCNVSLYGQIMLIGSFTMYFPQEKSIFPVFGSFFFIKTSISQKNVWIFSRTTTKDRKLKFGMNDPYSMFFKIGYPFGDILFRFYTKWIFVSLLPKHGRIWLENPVFEAFWGNSKTKIHIAQKRKKISPNGCPILKNI